MMNLIKVDIQNILIIYTDRDSLYFKIFITRVTILNKCYKNNGYIIC